jgi:hypothetical protein
MDYIQALFFILLNEEARQTFAKNAFHNVSTAGISRRKPRKRLRKDLLIRQGEAFSIF